MIEPTFKCKIINIIKNISVIIKLKINWTKYIPTYQLYKYILSNKLINIMLFLDNYNSTLDKTYL